MEILHIVIAKKSHCSRKYKKVFSVVVCIPKIPPNARWAQQGVTVAGGNGQGDAENQLSMPYGLYVDDDQTVYVADTGNHRVVEWKPGAKRGTVVAGGNGKGNRADQLNEPRGVVFDKSTNSIIISDNANRRIVRWFRGNRSNGEVMTDRTYCSGLAMDHLRYLYASDTPKDAVWQYEPSETHGTIVAGGNQRGDRLNQLNTPFYIFVDQDQSLYVSEYKNHRITKWVNGAKAGVIVAGGRGTGNSSNQLSSPQGVFVDQLGTIYIADSCNNRIIRWCKGENEGNVIVDENLLCYPTGLSFDRHGNIYVIDWGRDRVQRFSIDKSL